MHCHGMIVLTSSKDSNMNQLCAGKRGVSMLLYHGVVVHHISGVWHRAQACLCNFPGIAANALAAIRPWHIRRCLIWLHLHQTFAVIP